MGLSKDPLTTRALSQPCRARSIRWRCTRARCLGRRSRMHTLLCRRCASHLPSAAGAPLPRLPAGRHQGRAAYIGWEGLPGRERRATEPPWLWDGANGLGRLRYLAMAPQRAKYYVVLTNGSCGSCMPKRATPQNGVQSDVPRPLEGINRAGVYKRFGQAHRPDVCGPRFNC
jgi:hypothetical protein